MLLLWTFEDRIDLVIRNWRLLNDGEEFGTGFIRKTVQATRRLTDKLRKRSILLVTDRIVHQ